MPASTLRSAESEFFIDNLLVRVHFIIVMIRWTGLAPWEFEFPFPGSLTSTFLVLFLLDLDKTVEETGARVDAQVSYSSVFLG